MSAHPFVTAASAVVVVHRQAGQSARARRRGSQRLADQVRVQSTGVDPPCGRGRRRASVPCAGGARLPARLDRRCRARGLCRSTSSPLPCTAVGPACRRAGGGDFHSTGERAIWRTSSIGRSSTPDTRPRERRAMSSADESAQGDRSTLVRLVSDRVATRLVEAIERDEGGSLAGDQRRQQLLVGAWFSDEIAIVNQDAHASRRSRRCRAGATGRSGPGRRRAHRYRARSSRT